ncbi:MAG: TrkH family potassium uptake protein [Chloroflexota bacterium]
MRTKVIIHYLGLIIACLGLAMLVPLICSLWYREPDLVPFLISAATCGVIGTLLWRLIPVRKVGLSRREALVLVAGAWILISAFGALPYMLAGVFTSYVDAYFEAMSGYTTTGATVLTSIETQYHGILLWRNFTQWLGGMGIITLFVALFPLLGMGAAHLVEAEVPGPQTEQVTARIRDTAKVLWYLYVGFSVLEVISLRIAGMPLFDAITVTMGTMPTGGFTPTNLSIAAYQSATIEGIVTLFMAIAGVNFALYYFLLWKRQPRQVFTNPEFRLYIAILVGGTLLVTLNLARGMDLPFGEAFRYSSFQVVSIMTTTGFVTADFNVWPAFARAALLILMIIGASAGSTGGALKVTRVLVLAKHAYRRIILIFSPRAVIPLKLGKNTLPEGVVSRILAMAFLYFAILVAGFLIMSALGLDQVTALSSVAATLGNVGPGLGLVGPVENYAFLPSLGKIVLTVCMLAGRLELFTILVLFSPAFWRWRKTS